MLEHGVDRHCLNPTTLIETSVGWTDNSQVVSTNNLQLNSQLGCESLHIHGRRGALFKITLWPHGYTFVGKGTPVDFLAGAQQELVYSRLSPIQGMYVPVLLGSLRLAAHSLMMALPRLIIIIIILIISVRRGVGIPTAIEPPKGHGNVPSSGFIYMSI
ncbi:hypothetical protein BDW75DRAFT_198061 [Aspergillus navahoensis]